MKNPQLQSIFPKDKNQAKLHLLWYPYIYVSGPRFIQGTEWRALIAHKSPGTIFCFFIYLYYKMPWQT